MCDSLFSSFKFVVFSFQQMVKNLKSSSANSELQTIFTFTGNTLNILFSALLHHP